MSDSSKDAKTLTQAPPEPAETSDERKLESGGQRSPSSRDVDFGSRYQVRKAVGRGGMGEVYRAYDTALTREVALKVVRADRADNEIALGRFRREVALASKVTHENVLRVYDLAESGDQRFLSMQYVEGRDLAELTRKERPLPLARAVALFRQVCEGLAAAHRQGIVHRDLKPQNILVDEADHVYVADFGLARSVDDATLTVDGALLGSPAYMSPEQVKGDPLDARSDIYSMGVILYELLTGEAPFQGSSAHSVMEQRLHKKPALVRSRNAGVPARLERVAERCLELDPAARYASVGELLQALDAPDQAPRAPRPARPIAGRARSAKLALLAVGLGGIVAAAVVAWRHHGEVALVPAEVGASPASAAVAPAGSARQVLVLGVENRTADPLLDGTLEYVLGMALRRSTTLTVSDGPQERGLASELGVDGPSEELGRRLLARDGGKVWTVRGSVASRGAGYALSIEARDASSGAVVAERALEATDPSRVAPVLGALAWSLRSALGEPATADPKAAEETGASPSLEADHEYAVGRAFVGIGRNDEALPHLERAVAIDPEFAVAQARLSITLWNDGRTTEAAEHFKVALKWSARMGEYDRRSLLGDYYGLTGESDRAVDEYEEMLRVWPGNLTATIDLCDTYLKNGNVDRAVAVCRSCAKDHPKDVIARSNELNALLLGDSLEDVRAGAERLVADFPHPLWTAYEYRGIASALLGRRDEAKAAYGKLGELEPSVGALATADLALYEGRLDDAARALDQGIAADLAAKNADAAKRKWTIVSQLRLRRGDRSGAIAAADKAATSLVPATVYAAAQAYVDAGQPRRALPFAARLDGSLATDARHYGRLLAAEALRAGGKAREAVDVYEGVLQKTDFWLARFLLARAYLDLGAFAEASGELSKCLARRGKGSLVYLDDAPSLRFLPLAQQAFARALDGMSRPEAADAYRALLALEPEEQHDPLAEDARRHAGDR